MDLNVKISDLTVGQQFEGFYILKEAQAKTTVANAESRAKQLAADAESTEIARVELFNGSLLISAESEKSAGFLGLLLGGVIKGGR